MRLTDDPEPFATQLAVTFAGGDRNIPGWLDRAELYLEFRELILELVEVITCPDVFPLEGLRSDEIPILKDVLHQQEAKVDSDHSLQVTSDVVVVQAPFTKGRGPVRASNYAPGGHVFPSVSPPRAAAFVSSIEFNPIGLEVDTAAPTMDAPHRTPPRRRRMPASTASSGANHRPISPEAARIAAEAAANAAASRVRARRRVLRELAAQDQSSPPSPPPPTLSDTAGVHAATIGTTGCVGGMDGSPPHARDVKSPPRLAAVPVSARGVRHTLSELNEVSLGGGEGCTWRRRRGRQRGDEQTQTQTQMPGESEHYRGGGGGGGGAGAGAGGGGVHDGGGGVGPEADGSGTLWSSKKGWRHSVPWTRSEASGPPSDASPRGATGAAGRNEGAVGVAEGMAAGGALDSHAGGASDGRARAPAHGLDSIVSALDRDDRATMDLATIHADGFGDGRGGGGKGHQGGMNCTQAAADGVYAAAARRRQDLMGALRKGGRWADESTLRDARRVPHKVAMVQNRQRSTSRGRRPRSQGIRAAALSYRSAVLGYGASSAAHGGAGPFFPPSGSAAAAASRLSAAAAAADDALSKTIAAAMSKSASQGHSDHHDATRLRHATGDAAAAAGAAAGSGAAAAAAVAASALHGASLQGACGGCVRRAVAGSGIAAAIARRQRLQEQAVRQRDMLQGWATKKAARPNDVQPALLSFFSVGGDE